MSDQPATAAVKIVYPTFREIVKAQTAALAATAAVFAGGAAVFIGVAYVADQLDARRNRNATVTEMDPDHE